MGAFEPVDSHNAEMIDGGVPKSKRIVGVTLLLGLFAPVLLTIYLYGMTLQIMLQSLFWTYYYVPSSMFPYSGFNIMPPSAIIILFPFVLLRLVPVSQIYRYYQGKTTRRRTLIASVFGDGFFLFYILILLIIYSALGIPFGAFPIPLPCQFLFCIVMLWRYPIPEPTTPWEGMEHQSWWEKDQEPKEPKPKDEDALW